MRRARVNFEIVPDEEIVPIATVANSTDWATTVESMRQNTPPEIVSVSVEGRELETSITDRLLAELSTAQTQEEIDAILTNYESPAISTELGNAQILPTSELITNEEIEIPAIDEPDFFESIEDDETEGSIAYDDNRNPIESPEDIFEPVAPVVRGRRRVHPTEEVPQQSINQELTPEELQMLEEAVIDAHREIPPNSGTLLISESTSRFSGAIWFEAIKTKTVMLAGLGGIGSYCSFLLSRMQPLNIILFDDDTVETVNLSGQLYSTQDVGNRKTTSLAEMMRNYGSYFNTNTYAKYTRESGTNDIMICGFDNMEARKIYFTNWLSRVNSKSTIEEKKKCLYIDGRLSAEFLQIFCLRGDDEYFKEQYATKHFFTDSQADATLCSYKQTTFMANMIGSLIVNLFVNFVANECEPLIDRDVPFLTEYSAETMFLNTVH
jgi:hypothetical protein